ncbi:efflux RND transporter periplasmic adaptor subunit [Leptolyngbya sp. FACHB-17]|uniref:efflux RND transporter periplasmic adaptor subunit n=1 Tax=unclassified Leptolyngbya TaxID=2650499 RepID=UPI001681077E|nr:efflux RND transporter periplasmic adaptor subunit [Leptolyngbya sp. FACHB-17]MBD2080557.1 efflux RND transporter periplasmic adaptor subunit [Leptolyngbya sp. FACHB-17]
MQVPLFGKVSKKPTRWLLALLAAGAIALPGGAFLVSRQFAPRQEAATISAESKTVTARISASGEVIPIRTVNLSPKTTGKIAQLLVDQGDQVAQGQVVARMDDKDIEAERAQAQARVAEAQARLDQLRAGTRVEEVRQAESEVARARGEVDRVQGLVSDATQAAEFARTQTRRQRELANQGAISTNSLDEFIRREQNANQTLSQARAQLSQSQAQLNQANQQLAQRQNGARPEEIRQSEAQLAAAIAQLQQVQNRLEDTYIRAPFSGVITQRYATVGAFVTPTTQATAGADGSASTSIFALANGLEVRAKVPEVDIGQIRRGQEVDIRVDAYPEESFKGRVRLIAPEAVTERDVTSFSVRIDILTGRDKLRSKMNANVNFLGDSIPNTLVVPTAALSTQRGQTGVWVPGENNKPRFQRVTTGLSFDNETQILDGIKAGDRIFVQPPEGQKIDNANS